MSIATSLSALRGVRDAIRDAIVGKGGSLPSGSPMGSYAQAITNLPSGGGGGGDTEIPFRSRLEVPGDTDPWHLTHLTATGVPTYAFYQDTSLTTVSLPAATSIGSNAFRDCTSLTSVDFPALTSLGMSAFRGCSALTTADFPLVTSISDSAFYNCSALTTADFPLVTNIIAYAFRGCSALTTADFPAVASISDYAFYNCSALATADFPLVTSLGTYTFRGCSSLTSLTLSNTKVAALSSASAFTSTPIADGTGHIYVPDDLVDQYKAATNWDTYADQILPISQKP